MPEISGIALFVLTHTLYLPLPVDPPTPPDLFSPAGVAIQLGLAPAALSGAGASTQQAEALLGALALADGDCAGLRTLMEAVDSASTPESRVTALAALNTAQSALRGELMELLPLGVDSTTSEISIGVGRGLPPDLAAAVYSQGGSSVLSAVDRVKRMLIAERRATRMGKPLNQHIAAQLATLRAHPNAVAAREYLASSLGDIEGAFDSAWTTEAPPP